MTAGVTAMPTVAVFMPMAVNWQLLLEAPSVLGRNGWVDSVDEGKMDGRALENSFTPAALGLCQTPYLGPWPGPGCVAPGLGLPTALRYLSNRDSSRLASEVGRFNPRHDVIWPASPSWVARHTCKSL